MWLQHGQKGISKVSEQSLEDQETKEKLASVFLALFSNPAVCLGSHLEQAEPARAELVFAFSILQ